MESALSALVNTCIDHEKNCRKVLMQGLDVLVGIAESGGSGMVKGEGSGDSGSSGNQADENGQKYGSTNASLAADVLQLIGPYNYIVCKGCKTKNQGGTTCVECGHAIAFEVA